MKERNKGPSGGPPSHFNWNDPQKRGSSFHERYATSVLLQCRVLCAAGFSLF